MVEKVFGLV